jgi:hypothetical protein
MNAQDVDLEKLLKRLHLPTVARLYPSDATRAATEGWSHRDFLALRIAKGDHDSWDLRPFKL